MLQHFTRKPTGSGLSRLGLLSLLLFTACGSSSGASSAGDKRSTVALATPTEPSLPAPARGSYVALGASETYGIGAQPHTVGYAYLVAKMLNPRQVLNRGIPGTTLHAAYDTELTTALAQRPQLCTVFFGFNDLAAGVKLQFFSQDLHDFVATLRRSGSRVLIIGMPDLAHLPAARRFPAAEHLVTQWNRRMRVVAHQTGSSFLDLNSYGAELAAHPGYISVDGLHPSNMGHRALARVVFAAIVADHLWSKS